MKRKLLMALLAGTLAIAAPVSCFAAETTEAAEADAAEDSSDEEEDADAEEADAESADSDDTKEEKTAAKKKEDLKTVGEKTEGCIAFKLRNGTGKKITGLAIKTADETEFPENMMEADDVFELKEKKRVYFSKENSEAETAEETSEDTAPTYEMQLTFEDGTTADVHGIVLEDLGTLTLREKDGIIYGTYKLKSTKEKKSTYDTEKAIADQAAADAAAAQAAADQAAAAQQTESYDYSYDNNDYSYDYSADYSYDYGGGDDYSGGDDGGDGCLDDGLLN